MKNQVIKALNKEHGKKVIQFWKNRGVDIEGFDGSTTEADDYKCIYYGVINNRFSNHSLTEVQYANAEIIELPNEEKKTPSLQDLCISQKLLILDENGDIKHEHVLYDRSKEEVKEESVFKVGDKVYHFSHGWGIIEVLDSFVTVSFKDKKIHFNHNTQLLSFTEYTLQGFSQERPIELPEVGELCLMRDSDEDRWHCKVFYEYRINPEGNIFVTDEGEGFYQMKRIKILD